MQMMLGYDPDVLMSATGDEELDEIERRLAAGEDPDEVLKGWGDGGGSEKADDPPPEEESFEDQYDAFIKETL